MNDKKKPTPVEQAKDFVKDPEVSKVFKEFLEDLKNVGDEALLYVIFTSFIWISSIWKDGYDKVFHLENKMSFLDKDITNIKRKLKKILK